MVKGDVRYDLTVDEIGTFRVLLHPGTTTVEPIAEPGTKRDVDFHLSGPAAALAEFAAGGAGKRLKDTRAAGSKRRLRRLAKDLKRPIQLADVQASGALVEPGLILAVLGAAVDPAWTVGHAFVVGWDVEGPRGGVYHVRVLDGVAPTAGPGIPDDGAAATVHVRDIAFLALLGGLPLPVGGEARVEGNAHAVALLRRWYDQAQGLETASS